MPTYNETSSGGIIASGLAITSDQAPLGYKLSPVIRFRVNLRPIQNNMTIGPETNERTTAVPVLVDLGPLVEMSIPGVSQNLRHGDEFVLQGQLCTRTLQNHSTGIEGDYTSSPLIVLKRY